MLQHTHSFSFSVYRSFFLAHMHTLTCTRTLWHGLTWLQRALYKYKLKCQCKNHNKIYNQLKQSLQKHFHHSTGKKASGKTCRQHNKLPRKFTNNTNSRLCKQCFFHVLKKKKQQRKKYNIIFHCASCLCRKPQRCLRGEQSRAEWESEGKTEWERESGRETRRGRNTTYLLLLQMQQLDCAYFAARVTSAWSPISTASL